MMSRLLAAGVVSAMVIVAGYGIDGAVTDANADDDDILGPGLVTVVMDVHHSRFSIEELRVRPGTMVRFEVHNDDPIPHELVVGPDEVHAEHESGTHFAHPPVPGEVSLPPNTSGTTFWQFDEPGEVRFACHLPGHVDYGMVGRVIVES